LPVEKIPHSACYLLPVDWIWKAVESIWSEAMRAHLAVSVEALFVGLFLSGGLEGRAAAAEEKHAVLVAGRPVEAWASSTQVGRKSALTNLFDGKADTAWVPKSDHDGKDEWVAIDFEQPVTLEGFVLVPGYAKGDDAFYTNPLPRVVSLTADDKLVGEYMLSYWKDIDCKVAPTEVGNNASPRIVILRRPVAGQTFKLTVKAVLQTRMTRYHDMALSELSLLIKGTRSDSSLPDVQVATELLRAFAQTGRLGSPAVAASTRAQAVLRSFAPLSDQDQATVQQKLVAAGAESSKTALDNFEATSQKALLDTAVTLAFDPFGGLTRSTGRLFGASLFGITSSGGTRLAYFPTIVLDGSLPAPSVAALGGTLGTWMCQPPELPSPR